jgi:hypothetical protein
VTSVAVGVWIGAVGVFLLFPEREPLDTDDGDRTSSAGGLPSHEALRYGAPSSANVRARSGYVVAYDYRWAADWRTARTWETCD